MPLGQLNFTPARFTVFLFFVPAIMILFRSDRKWILPDLFAAATTGWIITASLLNGGYQTFALAEALEFLGAYLIGRAYFFDRLGIKLFIRVFKVVTLVVISLGFLDTVFGYAVTQQFMGLTKYQLDYRMGLFRADSVFPVGELFGTFCVAATALFLYSEQTIPYRIFYSTLGIIGTAASLSSGPLLSLVICLAIFGYDIIFNKIQWRWKLLTGGYTFACTLRLHHIERSDRRNRWTFDLQS